MPVLGICNGFQILCEAHLLPGALIRNDVRTFVCKDQPLRVENAGTAWTSRFEAGQEITIVLKNGEGGFVADADTLERLEGEGRVVFRYAGSNPNGSLNDIAGISNERGQRRRPDAAPRAQRGRPDRTHARRAPDLRERAGLPGRPRLAGPAHGQPTEGSPGAAARAVRVSRRGRPPAPPGSGRRAAGPGGRRVRAAARRARARPDADARPTCSPSTSCWSAWPAGSQLTDTDRTVLAAHLDDVQAGVVSTRPRYTGACAAAGWTTLGAGRRAAVGPSASDDRLCSPQVAAEGAGARVVDWDARLAAAAASRGDARLGNLAGSSTGCVAAVGPGAALAAARPDGTVAAYATPRRVRRRRRAADLPGDPRRRRAPPPTRSSPRWPARDDVTLLVSGIGPAAGSDDPSLGVFYRVGTTLPGWATSASTRREGIVTLTDLTRELVDVGRGSTTAVTTIDGSPLAVYPADLTVAAVERQNREVAALSDALGHRLPVPGRRRDAAGPGRDRRGVPSAVDPSRGRADPRARCCWPG